MKISKTVILTLGVMFLAGSMGLILVNAQESPEEPEIDIYVDPSNAVQHIQEVQFVSTGGNTTTAKMVRKDDRLVGIQTAADFVLSKTGDEANIILTQYGYNSILGGIKNKVLNSYSIGDGGVELSKNSKYSVILAGLENLILGKNNVIVGGENNIILGDDSTILGGGGNVVSGNYSVAGGERNDILGDYSAAIGKNNFVEGNNSVALGNRGKIEANNSLLIRMSTLTVSDDGVLKGPKLPTTEQTKLTEDNVFAIDMDSGVVINDDKAHSFAMLTVGGSLSIFSNSDDVNIQCGTGKGGGIVKAVNTEEGQMCLCSCDGSGWNSLFAKGRCIGACDQDKKPKCGNNVERVCSNSDEGGFTYSGECIVGTAIEGEGSYLVDKNDIVHRSCQTEDGSIEFCTGTISSRVSSCAHKCEGTLPNNAHANGREMTDQGGVEYFYALESMDDCSYSCDSGYNYIMDAGKGFCVKCKAGTYNSGEMNCIQDVVCIPPAVPDGSGGCTFLGVCLATGDGIYTPSYNTTEQYKQRDNWFDSWSGYFKPYGNVEMFWTCKENSGEVEPHSCEFSCISGYVCNNNWGGHGHQCIKDGLYRCTHWSRQYTGGQTAWEEEPNFGRWRWHHPTENPGGSVKYTYLDSLEALHAKQAQNATGCYYTCDLGFRPDSDLTNGYCKSNCQYMKLGVRVGGVIWKDGHEWNEINTQGNKYFYNGRFPRAGSHQSWTYVASGDFDNYVANETGKCLWTCRSGIPVAELQNIPEFKSKIDYYIGRQHYHYNTCWEKCADNYYFSGFKCVEVTTNQYIPDPDKTITYSGITNIIAEKKVCTGSYRYQNGVCVSAQSGCAQTGAVVYNNKCYTCYEGRGLTGAGADIHCVEYDRCDVNQNWLINEKDRQSISNCIGGIGCNGRENLDGTGEVNSGDLQYFDDNCYKKMCDHNGDEEINNGDLNLYINHCKNQAEPPSRCDLNGDGEYTLIDNNYWEAATGKCKKLLLSG